MSAEFEPPKQCVLIIDDERANRDLLEVMLGTEGLRLITAASGPEALAEIAKCVPDLILLDLMMPAMDGFELSTKLKNDPATRHVPIIIITALDDRHSRMLALRSGVEELITKPVDRAELCVRVRNLLRLKAAGDEGRTSPNETILDLDASEAVGQLALAATLTGELDNLMSVILSRSMVLVERLKLDDPTRADVEALHDAGIRGMKLTRELLALCRPPVAIE